MLVKCKKCLKKLKVSDDKITAEGIKVKCPTCASILLVKKPAPKEAAKEQLVKKEEPISETFPDLSFSAEEVTTPLTPPISQEMAEKEISIPEEKPVAAEERPEEPQQGFDDSFATPQETAAAPSQSQEAQQSPAQQPLPAAAGEEEFKIEETSLAPSAEPGKKSEEFQLDTNFDFSEEASKGSTSAAPETSASTADLVGEVPPGEESFEVMQTSTPTTADAASYTKAPETQFKESPAPASKPQVPPEQQQPRKKPPAAKEVTGYGVSTRRSMPVTPLILMVLILIALYFLYQKLSAPTASKGRIIVEENYTGEFANNEKEGKIFIISGKVKNGYQTERSFIQVKGILYDKDNNEVASKTVYAGNFPTDLECRKLPIEEIDKLLNVKIGEKYLTDKELSNMNVPPGTSVKFKIVFAGVREDKIDKFKVMEAGSE